MFIQVCLAKDLLLALTSDGKVFSIGDSAEIVGRSGDCNKLIQIPHLSSIISIAASPSSCFAITESGDVFGWGSHLGGVVDGVNRLVAYPFPVKCQTLTNIKYILNVFDFYFAVSHFGELFVWYPTLSSNDDLPGQCQPFPIQINVPRKAVKFVFFSNSFGVLNELNEFFPLDPEKFYDYKNNSFHELQSLIAFKEDVVDVFFDYVLLRNNSVSFAKHFSIKPCNLMSTKKLQLSDTDDYDSEENKDLARDSESHDSVLDEAEVPVIASNVAKLIPMSAKVVGFLNLDGTFAVFKDSVVVKCAYSRKIVEAFLDIWNDRFAFVFADDSLLIVSSYRMSFATQTVDDDDFIEDNKFAAAFISGHSFRLSSDKEIPIPIPQLKHESEFTYFKSEFDGKVAIGFSSVAIVKDDGSVWISGSRSDGGGKSFSFVKSTVFDSYIADRVKIFFDDLYVFLNDGTILYQDDEEWKPIKIDGKTIIDVVGGSGLSEWKIFLTSDGLVYSRGQNCEGQLGRPDCKTGSSKYPLGQVPGMENIIQISAGKDFVLALSADGSVFSWGSNESSQLGHGKSERYYYSAFPKEVVGLPTIVSVYADSQRCLALAADGSLFLSGSAYLLHSIASDGQYHTPVALNLPFKVKSFALGDHLVVVSQDGKLYTAGDNSHGQCGVLMSSDNGFNQIMIDDVIFVDCFAGNYATVCIDSVCGKNDYGRLGDGKGSPVYTPTCFGVSLDSTVVLEVNTDCEDADFIVVDDPLYYPINLSFTEHGIVCTTDNFCFLWDLDDMVNNGINHGVKTSSPTLLDFPEPIKTAVVIKMYIYVLTTDGTVYELPYIGCWTKVCSNVHWITGGDTHLLMLKTNGQLYSMGSNSYGQLGDGTTVDRDSPVRVSGLSRVVFISSGSRHNLVVTQDGTLYGFGWNLRQQLFDSDFSSVCKPTKMFSNVRLARCSVLSSAILMNDGSVELLGQHTIYNDDIPVDNLNIFFNGDYLFTIRNQDELFVAKSKFESTGLKGIVGLEGREGYREAYIVTKNSCVQRCEIDSRFSDYSRIPDLKFFKEVSPLFPIVQETLIEEVPIVQEDLIEDVPVVQETLIEEVPIIQETIIEEVPVVQETLIEDVPVVQETLIEEVPIIQETIIEEVPVVQETLIEDVPVVQETLIEEVPIIQETIIEEVPVVQETLIEEVPVVQETLIEEVPVVQETLIEEVPVVQETLIEEVPVVQETLIEEVPVVQETLIEEVPVVQETLIEEVPVVQETLIDDVPVVQETLIDDVPVVQETLIEEVPVVQETLIEEVPVVQETLIEEVPVVQETIIEEVPVVQETLIEEVPVVQETIIEEVPVVQETIIEEVPVVQETLIEEVPVVQETLINATPIIQSTNDPRINKSLLSYPIPPAFEYVPNVFSGHLIKQGNGWKSWKRRWFVLSSLDLVYHDDESEGETLGVVRLFKSSKVFTLSALELRAAKVKQDPSLCFCVQSRPNDRVFYLVADSETIKNDWIQAISRVIDGSVR
ncbi:hypothetical protein RCL1_002535 [Eukaryota sp. TZLM3-RCL]